jgi:hypothetical protein
MNENIESVNRHSVTNFKPEEYEVLDYLDNQRPRYCGMPVQLWKEEIAAWEANIAFYFPHWKSAGQGHPEHNIHKCRHCGNTNVRYIVAVLHHPTQTNVVFGSDCVEHLGFANRSAFKAAQVRARAEQGNARLRVYHQRVEFLKALPELEAFLKSENLFTSPLHANNHFARDIVAKLNQYGSISPRQVECLMASIQRDLEAPARQAERDARKAAAGPAPEGRQEVSGEVVMVRDYDSQFGVQTKMLVVLANGSTVFVSVPSSATVEKGQQIKFTATFTPKADDKTFAFGKRPTKLSVRN